jgi:hypothetical protein
MAARRGEQRDGLLRNDVAVENQRQLAAACGACGHVGRVPPRVRPRPQLGQTGVVSQLRAEYVPVRALLNTPRDRAWRIFARSQTKGCPSTRTRESEDSKKVRMSYSARPYPAGASKHTPHKRWSGTSSSGGGALALVTPAELMVAAVAAAVRERVPWSRHALALRPI